MVVICHLLLACALSVLDDSGNPGAVEAPGLQFSFRNSTWNEPLDWIAGAMGLKLQADIIPPGRFTYSDPRSYTPAEAFDLLHGVLLDRGFTLVPRYGLLIVARLADETHLELAPHVPVELIDQAPDSQIVATSIRCHNASATDLSREIEPLLSARGIVRPAPTVGRMIVIDRAGIIRQVLDMLQVIDPAEPENRTQVRAFFLRHANAREAARVLKDLLGVDAAGSGGAAGLIDFQKMGEQLGNRQMLEAFVPGISMKGLVADAPTAPVQTRISVDDDLNAVLIVGDPAQLGKAAEVLKSIDKPGPGPERVMSRSFRVSAGQGQPLAAQLQKTFADEPGLRIVGAEDVIVATGIERQLDRIEEILRQSRSAEPRVAVFAIRQSPADEVVLRLEAIFKSEPEESRPTFASNPEGTVLLVRGAEDQLQEVRGFLAQIGELSSSALRRPAAPAKRQAVPTR
jgi:hypothetical protein